MPFPKGKSLVDQHARRLSASFRNADPGVKDRRRALLTAAGDDVE